jgi:hypothetical protein
VGGIYERQTHSDRPRRISASIRDVTELPAYGILPAAAMMPGHVRATGHVAKLRRDLSV